MDTGKPSRATRQGECSQRPDGSWTCWPDSALEAVPAPQTDVDRDWEVFRIASEHFRHDHVSLWTQSSLFLLIQGALFAVFANVLRDDGDSGVVSRPMAALGTALVALIFACAWGWVANRRLKLLSAWRANVTHLDGVVDRHGIYLRVEPHAGQTPWRTPSGLTARFPWLVSLLWIAAVIWLLALLVQGQS